MVQYLVLAWHKHHSFSNFLDRFRVCLRWHKGIILVHGLHLNHNSRLLVQHIQDLLANNQWGNKDKVHFLVKYRKDLLHQSLVILRIRQFHMQEISKLLELYLKSGSRFLDQCYLNNLPHSLYLTLLHLSKVKLQLLIHKFNRFLVLHS